MRRGEQPFDDALISIRPPIINEVLHFGDGGWEAGQIKAQPSDQGDAIRFGRGFDALILQPRENEMIDGVARPGGLPHRWRRHTNGRRECPLLGCVRFGFACVLCRRSREAEGSRAKGGDTGAKQLHQPRNSTPQSQSKQRVFPNSLWLRNAPGRDFVRIFVSHFPDDLP